MAKRAVWGVEVNEIKILTYGGISEDAVRRWILWRSRMDRTNRITVLNGLSIAGELIHVACDDRDDARQIAEMLQGWGVHKSALNVKRLANEPGAGKTSMEAT
jgi:hypothetical protein